MDSTVTVEGKDQIRHVEAIRTRKREEEDQQHYYLLDLLKHHQSLRQRRQTLRLLPLRR